MTYELFESYSEFPLPSISEPLFDNFGYRPTSFLVHITFWLWWPFLWACVHTHFYYPSSDAFRRVYAYRLILCCSLVVLYTSIYAIVAATPRIILLADLSHEPSRIVKLIPNVSRIFPLLFLAFATRWAYGTTVAFRDKNGAFRICHKIDKDKFL